MLEILDQEYYEEVIEFVDSIGLRKQFNEQIYRLTGFYDAKAVCKLGKDFAPHSFSFAVYLDGKFKFNGGLIYQGPDSPANGSAPSFTVSLAEGTGWFIHT